MKNRTFAFIIFTLLAVLTLLTIIHFIYVLYAYQHCSIIYFIGKELW